MSTGTHINQPFGRGRRLYLLAVVSLAIVLAATLVAIALASTGSSTVNASSSSRLGRIVVDSQGRTLYALSPETTSHLLCKSSECFKFWPPLTVHSTKTKVTAGSGVHGRLGLLHRSGGMLQVTLNGRPLYRYAGDHAKGQTNGQGIHSFGGTWHALAASGGVVSTTQRTTSTTSTSSTTSEPYHY